MFDQDRPLAREKATRQRVFRKADDPNHVFIFLEFDSVADAEEARDRLLKSACSTVSRTRMGRTCWRKRRSRAFA